MFTASGEASRAEQLREAIPAAIERAATAMVEPEFREFSGLDAVRRLSEEAGSWPEVAEDWQWCARFGYQVIERRGTGGGAFRLMYSRFLEEAGRPEAPLAAEAAAPLDRARRRLPRRQRERGARIGPLAGGRRRRRRRLRGRGAALDLTRARATPAGRWPRATRSCGRPGASSGLAGEAVAGAGAEPPGPCRRGRAARRADGRAGCAAHGKNLLIDFGELALHSHLGMNGSWHVYAPRRALAQAGPLGLGGAAPRTASRRPSSAARRCGCSATGALRRDPVLARLGPDILAPDFDLGRSLGLLRAAPGRELGDALLDQGWSPGSATSSRARPASRPASTPGGRSASSTDEELERVLAAARRLMLEAVESRPPPPRRLPAGPGGPARAAARRSARAARATPTAPPTGARVSGELIRSARRPGYRGP